MKFKMRLPAEAKLHSVAPWSSHACIAIIVAVCAMYSNSVHAAAQRETACLAENIYFEARGESTDAQYILGMLTLARVADPDWPKTICGVVEQRGQFSWTQKRIARIRDEAGWDEARAIARDLMRHAWTQYVLPKGWECARWYKRTDGRGVSKKSMEFFDKELFPVGTFGNQTAFQKKEGCSDPLPTQS